MTIESLVPTDHLLLYTDSTHLKANANKNKFHVLRVEIKPVEYQQQLEASVDEDRAAHRKRELKAKASPTETKEIKVSRTDSESGHTVRDDNHLGFFYLDHRTVDGRDAIITDMARHPANVHDCIPYLKRLHRQGERFGFQVQAVGLDVGYSTSAIAEGLNHSMPTTGASFCGRAATAGWGRRRNHFLRHGGLLFAEQAFRVFGASLASNPPSQNS